MLLNATLSNTNIILKISPEFKVHGSSSYDKKLKKKSDFKF